MPFSSTPLIFSPAQEPFPQSRPDIALKTFYLVTADSPVQRTHAFTSAFTHASQAHSQLGVKGAKKRGRSCTLVAVEKEKQAPERPFSQIRRLVIHKNTSAPLCSFLRKFCGHQTRRVDPEPPWVQRGLCGPMSPRLVAPGSSAVLGQDLSHEQTDLPERLHQLCMNRFNNNHLLEAV